MGPVKEQRTVLKLTHFPLDWCFFMVHSHQTVKMETGGFVHLVLSIWTGVKAVICILLLTKILVEKVLVWFQVDSGSIHSLCESKQINPTKDFVIRDVQFWHNFKSWTTINNSSDLLVLKIKCNYNIFSCPSKPYQRNYNAKKLWEPDLDSCCIWNMSLPESGGCLFLSIFLRSSSVTPSSLNSPPCMTWDGEYY